MEVGREIRRLREGKGWSQAKLAAAADMGVSGISQIETGARNPSAVTLSKIAEALGVGVADLFPLGQPRLPEWTQRPPGEGYFVPLEEGEEPDVVTLRMYYVRLLEENDRLLQEVTRLREELAKGESGAA